STYTPTTEISTLSLHDALPICNHARIGGAGAGDSGNDNLIGRGEKNLAHLANRFIGHRAENDREWNRVKMLVEEIAQRPRSGRIMRSVQQQTRFRRRRPDYFQPPWPFGFVQSFDNRRRRNVETGGVQLLGDVDCDQSVRYLMPTAQSQSRGVFITRREIAELVSPDVFVAVRGFDVEWV